MDGRPSIGQLETLLATGEREKAFDLTLRLLQAIDDRYGRLDNIDISDMDVDAGEEDVAIAFCTRFAAALGALLIDPRLDFTALKYESLLLHHRWIDLVFAISGFRTSDHLFPRLASAREDRRLTLDGANFLRLLSIVSLDSRIGIDFDRFWLANPVGAALAFLQHVSSRYVLTPRAFAFRERLLEWLPDRLDDVKLGTLVLSRLPEIYMHCSYALTPRKHRIKSALMRQMRRACLEAGCIEAAPSPPQRTVARPTAFVVCEHFVPGHSMYRTHSLAVQSLRARFHTVGVIYRHQRSPEIEALFDEVTVIPEGDFLPAIRALAAEIVRRNTALVFYPSIGMTPHAIALASLRLAPVQCASYGHAATTMSPAIDYMVVPEDFVASHECFSESVIGLPAAAMPFRRRNRERAATRSRPEHTRTEGTVRVAIPASMMKLNPHLFDALGRIAEGAKAKVEFRFFPLASTGLPHFHLTRVLASRLPQARVFPESSHETYVERLRDCDLFLCPFPYGNTNSIVDALEAGLPGICLDGAELHAHIDAALFARIGFPQRTVAKTVDDYIAAAIAMIDSAERREECRNIALQCDLDRAFFSGDARLFCDAVAALVPQAP